MSVTASYSRTGEAVRIEEFDIEGVRCQLTHYEDGSYWGIPMIPEGHPWQTPRRDLTDEELRKDQEWMIEQRRGDTPYTYLAMGFLTPVQARNYELVRERLIMRAKYIASIPDDEAHRLPSRRSQDRSLP